MSQPKVIQTAKRKLEASEPHVQDLIDQITKYNQELKSLGNQQTQATEEAGVSPERQKALAGAIEKDKPVYEATLARFTELLRVENRTEKELVDKMRATKTLAKKKNGSRKTHKPVISLSSM